jgi:hypothetical protein
MAIIDIIGGPSKDELVSRMLSSLPVIFLTTGGSTAVLIEAIQETDASGNHLSFVGRIVVGTDTGARVEGRYDAQATTGTMTTTSNGA